MPVEIYQADAFTNKAFAGNPAAVCVLKSFPDDSWMKSVANEMSLSETAFLVPQGKDFQIRWFTPTHEVDLCGHATLASAHILFETGIVSKQSKINFSSKGGHLEASISDGWISLDFPAKNTQPATQDEKDALTRVTKLKPLHVERNDFLYLVELSREEEVKSFHSTQHTLLELNLSGLTLTAKGTGKYDFVSRSFFPKIGIPEDPVTGAAHCALGPYWSRKLKKNDFHAFQASARGGFLKVNVRSGRVLLSGQAVTTLKGTLFDS